jgi:transglutaminase-like putative cysteine protease
MRTALYIGLVIIFLVACTSPTITATDADSILDGATLGETRRYLVRQHLSLSNVGTGKPEKQNLWVALIRDFEPYQRVSERLISPESYVLFSDEYGNLYAEFDLSEHPPGTTIEVEIESRVEVYEVAYEWSQCEGPVLDDFVQPELHIESLNPQIVELSEELAAGKYTACEKVRAFYNYTGDELVYSYNQNDWGAQATFGVMGADCTEYASLTIALSRAAGIPARYITGLRYLPEEERGGVPVEHAWLEAYFPGTGWVAVDPTLGRSAAQRERYFAHHTADHIIVTLGRNPSTLRGASYWSHLYWPGNSTEIRVKDAGWEILPVP